MSTAKHTPDLDERFTVNSFNCGCLIRSEFENGAGQKWISYCSTHRAAPELLEALEQIKCLLSVDPEANRNKLQLIEAAIRKAKGEQ